MGNYRRNYVAGGTFFFTVVSHHRHRFLTTSNARECLRNAISAVRNDRPFMLVAICLLPDHLHCVWTLPRTDSDYSTRWRLIKDRFTKSYRASMSNYPEDSVKPSTAGSIWQPRYWEHTCRDEEDLKRCVDYTHWNPVKHGLAGRVNEYPWSSFHRFVRSGEYSADWGGENPCPGWSQPD